MEKITRSTIDFGIHLGLTHSAIAVWDGAISKIIKNNENNNFTPSAVYIDQENQVRVGRQALERAQTEPEDACSEFMLTMGTASEYVFRQSNRKMKPEELSSEVLKSLRGDVKRRMNEDITAVVITVPSTFDLPACDATRRAAELAGFKQSYLIMEPIAAAIAYAAIQEDRDGQDPNGEKFWLVYDFGSGTFDTAVIQIIDEDFKIIGHSGDNHLGGKLINWAIVDEILAPQFVKDSGLRDFNRGNPKFRRAFTKLKHAAEEASRYLLVDDSADIDIEMLFSDDQNQYPFQYILKRSQVAKIASSLVKRSMDITRNVLDETGLGTANVEKLILVGEATLAPYIREQLADTGEGLGIPLDLRLDPRDVVAQGAAIYAKTIPLDLAPELAHSIGIRLQSGEMRWVLKKGYALPGNVTLPKLQMPENINQISPDKVIICFEFFEGESNWAESNTFIGRLDIHRDDLSHDWPLNSPRDFKFIVDEKQNVIIEVFHFGSDIPEIRKELPRRLVDK